MERAAGPDGLYGSPETHRVERLHDPPLGSAATGQEDIGSPVEQQQDGDMGEPAAALFESQIHADRHPAHRPDLHVDHGDLGRVCRRNLPDCSPLGKLNAGVARGQDGNHLITDGRGVRHHQDAGHGRRL